MRGPTSWEGQAVHPGWGVGVCSPGRQTLSPGRESQGQSRGNGPSGTGHALPEGWRPEGG